MVQVDNLFRSIRELFNEDVQKENAHKLALHRRKGGGLKDEKTN
jgi:hypothetical protein